MQRYFAKGRNKDEFILYDNDIHHIKNVMRYKEGDEIEIVDEKIVYKCKIKNMFPLKLDIISSNNEDKEMDLKLTIAISLVNEQKMDLILQKLTELGVSSIIPIKTERSIIRLDEKKEEKKINRWQTICKEASEQSKRTIVPKVENVISLKELSNIKSDLKLVCSLNENTKSINNYLNNDLKKVLFVIGPEGGFTEKEETYLLSNNFLPVSLGKRVLRVETAAIFVASIINYICEG